MAHRIAFFIAFGEPAKDHVVCHECDNKLCVNPMHLALGTNLNNCVDAVNRGLLKPFRIKYGNQNHATKLTKEQVAEIRGRYSAGKGTLREIGAAYNVGYSTIREIVKMRTWKCVGEAVDVKLVEPTTTPE